jgi:hypothetical protein
MGSGVILQSSNSAGGSVAMGQKRHFRPDLLMSAITPKADIRAGKFNVRFVPILLKKSLVERAKAR